MRRCTTRHAVFAALILLTPSVASAQVTIYTTFASWSAAVSGASIGLDTFDDLPVNSMIDAPLLRTAGAFTYRVSTDANPTVRRSGSMADGWLSPGTANDAIILDNFLTGTNAIAASMFTTNSAGENVLQFVEISWVTTAGSGSTFWAREPAAAFLGIVTTGTLTSLTIDSTLPLGSGFVWPTLNNLYLSGTGATVPEPASGALLAMGLLALAWRRRGTPRLRRDALPGR